MIEKKVFSSWILKPCSDGISIDVRPPERYQLQLVSLNNQIFEGYRKEIVSSSISILYNPENIKLTLYQSGRMLIETRDLDIAEKIVENVLNYFSLL